MPHAERPGGPVAAAQQCATDDPLGDGNDVTLRLEFGHGPNEHAEALLMKRGGSCYTSDGGAMTKARRRLRKDGVWRPRETASRRFVVTVHIDPAGPEWVVRQASACVFVQAPSPDAAVATAARRIRPMGGWRAGPDVANEVFARSESRS